MHRITLKLRPVPIHLRMDGVTGEENVPEACSAESLHPTLQ